MWFLLVATVIGALCGHPVLGLVAGLAVFGVAYWNVTP